MIRILIVALTLAGALSILSPAVAGQATEAATRVTVALQTREHNFSEFRRPGTSLADTCVATHVACVPGASKCCDKAELCQQCNTGNCCR
jgi:hypothetical protein